MGTALIYVFVAGMGAQASVAGLADAPAFVAGAFIWIFIHGLFCLAGAQCRHRLGSQYRCRRIGADRGRASPPQPRPGLDPDGLARLRAG